MKINSNNNQSVKISYDIEDQHYHLTEKIQNSKNSTNYNSERPWEAGFESNSSRSHVEE